MSEQIKNIDGDSFQEEVLDSGIPVLIDYWAEWCGPCKMIAPVLEDLSREYEGKLKIGKVNVDEASDLAARYGVRSIPTLIIFKNGEVEGTQIGAASKAQLAGFIDQHI